MNNRTIILWVFVYSLFLSCSREYDEDLKIYFVRTGNIYEFTESGDTPRMVLGGATYNYPSVSPDGNFLVCKNPANSVIFRISDWSLYKTLDATASSALSYSWSPDGTKIGATINAGYIAVYDVSTGTQLWNAGGGGKWGHFFTNDGLYVTETSGVNLNYYTPAVDAIPESTRILPGTFSNLKLSHDGLNIVADNGTNVFVINASTLMSQSVTIGVQPALSPDGNSIVFNRSGNLFICGIDGTSERQLTFSGTDSYPCYQY